MKKKPSKKTIICDFRRDWCPLSAVVGKFSFSCFEMETVAEFNIG